jgi:restriction system protein
LNLSAFIRIYLRPQTVFEIISNMDKKDTLFTVLSRAPWWISVAVGAAMFAIMHLFLPDIAAVAAALPFLGIAGYAGWSQLHAPSATNVAEILGKIRGMSSENFSAILGEAFRRDGYVVTEVFKGAVDLKLDKGGRVSIVSCKRWKAAQTGIGPLRELFEAKETQDAADCIYVAAGDFTANASAFATEKSIRLLRDTPLAELVARVERGQRGWFRFR